MQFTALNEFLILHAGETGNAEEVAYEIQSKLRVRSTVQSIDKYDVLNLPEEKYMVFLVSTTGDGEPPEIMKKFWNFLLRKGLASDALSGLAYSVFGLGDSSYDKFNAVARKLDKRLQMLGAVAMQPVGLGDDQAPYGYLSALNPWVKNIALYLQSANALLPIPPNSSLLNSAYKITAVDSAGTSLEPVSAHDGGNVIPVRMKVVSCERLTHPVWGQDVRHLKLRLEDNLAIVSPLYEVGDVAMVHYRNPAELVNKALLLIGEGMQRHHETFSATSLLNIELLGDKRPSRLPTLHHCTVQTLLEQHLDIGAVPKRSYFASLASYATHPEESAKLLELASDEGTDLYFDYCTKERKSYVEVLEEFRSCRPPLAVLLGAIQLIPPRQYSIASSPALCPREIELCVAVSHRTTPYGRRRTGLCSGFISRLSQNDTVLISIKPGTIRGTPLSLAIPSSLTDRDSNVGMEVVLSAPVPNILIGPGTGVAPMRGLIQHEVARQMYLQRSPSAAFTASNASNVSASGASGARSADAVDSVDSVSIPNAMLFFGCRKRERDFLYAADWEKINRHVSPYPSLLSNDAQQCEKGAESAEGAGGATGAGFQLQTGSIAVSAAFSQDQLVKDYVTHKIRAQGALICQMLQKGGNVFVAGSSKRMPADVRKALCAVLEEHAGLSAAESDAFLLRLARNKKYIVEAWS